MHTEDQRETIISQLEVLNKQVARQNSLRRMFFAGIVYGVGFFVGSAVIATIAFGILGPVFGHIGWLRNSYQEGTALQR